MGDCKEQESFSWPNQNSKIGGGESVYDRRLIKSPPKDYPLARVISVSVAVTHVLLHTEFHTIVGKMETRSWPSLRNTHPIRARAKEVRNPSPRQQVRPSRARRRSTQEVYSQITGRRRGRYAGPPWGTVHVSWLAHDLVLLRVYHA